MNRNWQSANVGATHWVAPKIATLILRLVLIAFLCASVSLWQNQMKSRESTSKYPLLRNLSE